MDYATAIQRVFELLHRNEVASAVTECLRLARHLRDYINAAVFLRELHPDKTEFGRAFLYYVQDVNKEEQKRLCEKSLEIWLATHTLPVQLKADDDEPKVFAIGVGELRVEREQWERAIEDLAIPSGMHPRDTAEWQLIAVDQKAKIRQRIFAINTIEQRIKTRCLNYVIAIEQQLDAVRKTQSFMHSTQNTVNNFFKAHSEDVFSKLQKASQLVDSTDREDMSLLLTTVRRAIKAVADHFYPARPEPVLCADGQQRTLDDEKYLNRLQHFLQQQFAQSSSRELLEAELNLLILFARKLNDVASKGVHTEVTSMEAKQGLVGLYLFLFNVITRLRQKENAEQS